MSLLFVLLACKFTLILRVRKLAGKIISLCGDIPWLIDLFCCMHAANAGQLVQQNTQGEHPMQILSNCNLNVMIGHRNIQSFLHPT
jgi:hypothetical protein